MDRVQPLLEGFWINAQTHLLVSRLNEQYLNELYLILKTFYLL